MKVIALTGPPCSGKETVKDILLEMCAERGLTARHLSFSGEIKREALARGAAESDIDRDTLTSLVGEMRRAEGAGVLAGRIVRRVAEEPADLCVVEAVRHPAEADVLREAFGEDFLLAAVTADVRTMAERLLARPRPDESRTAGQSLEVAEQLIRREIEGDPASSVQIGRCIEMADLTVENRDTLEKLRRAVRAQFDAVLNAAT